MPYLQKLFKRAQAEIYRWGANPDTNADTARNPLDRYEHLLGKLVELGHDETARASVARQAHIVGCELSCLDSVAPDAPTVEAECLDDYPALTVFHTAIRNGDSVETVRHLWQQAKPELHSLILETASKERRAPAQQVFHFIERTLSSEAAG